jgi:hypothetical protein
MEHEEQADRLEREAEKLEHESERVGDEIDEARDEWEAKEQDSSVPGAQPDQEADEEEQA